MVPISAVPRGGQKEELPHYLVVGMGWEYLRLDGDLRNPLQNPRMGTQTRWD